MLYQFDGKQPQVEIGTDVSALAHVIGDVIIGDRCYIGHGAILHGRSIGDMAVIGMGAVASLFSEVGKRSIVAEGCVVKLNQRIPDKVVVAGNPAQVVRAVTNQDEELWAFGKQIYIDLAAKYLEQGLIPVA